MKTVICLLATVTLFMAPISTLPQEGNNKPPIIVVNSPDVLKGIQGVTVFVYPSISADSAIKPSEAEITDAVELRLLEAGIKVVPKEEGTHSYSQPYLDIHVTITSLPKASAVAYSILCKLSSTGLFGYGGKPILIYGSSVWEKAETGILITNGNVSIIDRVKKVTEAFLLDYLKANPKK